jgi:hypothetical protein
VRLKAASLASTSACNVQWPAINRDEPVPLP